MIDRTFIREYLGSKIYNRALNYYGDGMIIEIVVDSALGGKNVSVRAKVKGSGYNVYKVRVILDAQGNFLRSNCDCPYYDSCKHEGAVLLKIVESMDDYFAEDENVEENEIDLVAEKKKDLVYEISPKPLAEEEISKLLHLKAVDFGKPKLGTYQTIFKLRYKQVKAKEVLTVSMMKRYIKKNGEWGAISDSTVSKISPTYSKAGEELVRHLAFCQNLTENFIDIADLIIKNNKELVFVTEDEKYIEIKKANHLVLSMPKFRFTLDKKVEFVPKIQFKIRKERSNHLGKRKVFRNADKLFAFDEEKATLYYVEKQIELFDFLLNMFSGNSYFNQDVAAALLDYANRYQPFLTVDPLYSKISVRHFDPIPVVYLKQGSVGFIAKLGLLYDTTFVKMGGKMGLVQLESDANQPNFVSRDPLKEFGFIDQFNAIIDKFSSSVIRHHNSYNDLYVDYSSYDDKRKFSGTIRDFILETGRPLMNAGFKVTLDPTGKKTISRKLKVEFKVTSGIDWFDLAVYRKKRDDAKKSGVEIEQTEEEYEEEKIKLTPELLQDGLFEHKGELHFLDDETIKQLAELSDGVLQKDGSIRIGRMQFTLIDLLYKMVDKRDSKLDDAFDLGNKLLQINKLPRVNLPKTLKGKLRPYQKSGYYWMSLLTDNEIGGCLADDMGLGKTIQTIALIQHLREVGIKGPMLIIVPVSTLFNWEAEFDKFAPSAKYMVHRGADRVKDIEFLTNQQIILTSYATLRNDIKIFEQIEFALLVLDEAQAIKNTTSQIFKAIKTLNSKRRLTLTGTPIENSTLELWSQMNFLNPGLLGSKKAFQRNFVRSIEKEGSVAVAEQLQKIVYPFILRRKKDKIAKDLPAKEEVILYVEMGSEQRKVYEKVRLEYQKKIAGEIKKKGQKFNLFALVIEGMLRLRQVCLFPGLVNDKWERVKSCKLERLQELLPEISKEGHKALLFSQFTQVLARLKKQLPYSVDELSYLDGSTKDRRKAVNGFQKDSNKKLFLISLKAGGTGINLTAAGYVFIFDPWWNPAVEAQAIDRAHRIGQDKKVFAYKLIVKDSIEEKIVNLQEKKKALADSLIGEDSASLKKMSDKEILALFK